MRSVATGLIEAIDLGKGITLVGLQRATPVLVREVEETIQAAGWTVKSTGGDFMGGMWTIEVSKGDERTLTAQGVE